MAKEFYVKIEGWIKIQPTTKMAQDFIEDMPASITVQVE